MPKKNNIQKFRKVKFPGESRGSVIIVDTPPALGQRLHDINKYTQRQDEKLFYNSIVQALKNSYFPPAQIIDYLDGGYKLRFAVAGFSREEISIEKTSTYLTIFYDHANYKEDIENPILYNGMKRKSWNVEIPLTDDINIGEVTLEDGILTIPIERIIPSEEVPEKISITNLYNLEDVSTEKKVEGAVVSPTQKATYVGTIMRTFPDEYSKRLKEFDNTFSGNVKKAHDHVLKYMAKNKLEINFLSCIRNSINWDDKIVSNKMSKKVVNTNVRKTITSGLSFYPDLAGFHDIVWTTFFYLLESKSDDNTNISLTN